LGLSQLHGLYPLHWGGLGLGFIKTKYTADVDGDGDSGSLTQHDTVFAWNLGAGCSYAFTENLSADLAYRYVGLGYTDISKHVDDNRVSIGNTPYANEFSLGPALYLLSVTTISSD